MAAKRQSGSAPSAQKRTLIQLGANAGSTASGHWACRGSTSLPVESSDGA